MKKRPIYTVDAKGLQIILRCGAWTIYVGLKNESGPPSWNNIVTEWRHEVPFYDLSKKASPFTPERADYQHVKKRAFGILNKNWKKLERQKSQPILPGLE